jgi:hypothetical protein
MNVSSEYNGVQPGYYSEGKASSSGPPGRTRLATSVAGNTVLCITAFWHTRLPLVYDPEVTRSRVTSLWQREATLGSRRRFGPESS